MGDGPPSFPQGFTCPVVLWSRNVGCPLSYTGLSPSAAGLSRPLLLDYFHHLCSCPQPRTPKHSVWVFSLSLATTQEITIVFSSSGYLDVSVPRVSLLQPMDSVAGDWTLLQPGFPIRTSTDQRLLAAPRGFSQLTTSFIGFWCQGIHPVLLVS